MSFYRAKYDTHCKACTSQERRVKQDLLLCISCNTSEYSTLHMEVPAWVTLELGSMPHQKLREI